MDYKILLITENDADLDVINNAIGIDQYEICKSSFDLKTEAKVLSESFPLILADYDLIRDKATIFYEYQKNRSKACLIFYGDNIDAQDISGILQKGIYSVIPRSLLSERIHETIVGGLENRKAFIEIMQMMDELKDVNDRLEDEKEALRIRNQELSFINRLSCEISYVSDWDRILHRIIKVGLDQAIEYSLFGLLYRTGAQWTLAVHVMEKLAKGEQELLKRDIYPKLLSQSADRIPEEEIILHFACPEDFGGALASQLVERIQAYPLSLAGKQMGLFFITPKSTEPLDNDGQELLSTLANILSLSLKNAQEYHKLRKAAVTDSLTGVYNHNGFLDFFSREFNRSKRYGKTLSLVMLDMDDFKGINDSLGHQAGDYVLRELAGLLKGMLRQPDIVSRYGGDEFVILLPETELREAEIIMERILLKLKKHTFEWGSEQIKASLSYGVSNSQELQKDDVKQSLIKLADSRLYTAKKS